MGKKVAIFRFSLALAFRSMTHRKFRTLLTVGGVMIGIFTFVSLMSITIGMREEVSGILEEFLGAGIIITSLEGGLTPSIPEAMIGQLEQIGGVEAVTGYIMDYMIIGTTYGPVLGVEPDKASLAFPIQVVKGRNLGNNDTYHAVAGAAVQTSVGAKLFLTGDISGSVIAVEIEVVGIAASLGDPMIDAGILIPLDTMQDIMNTENLMFVLVDCSIELSASVAQAIRDSYPDAQVIESTEIMEMINQILDLINVLLLVLSAITLTVGAIGIMNTTMMNVLERTREIGIIKAIGGSRAEVVEIFVMEAIFISIFGGALGCIAALFGVATLAPLTIPIMGMALPYSFPPYLFVIAMTMAILIGLGAALYPSLQAASVRPVEALRYE